MDREGHQAVQADETQGVGGHQLGKSEAFASGLSQQTAKPAGASVMIPALSLLIAVAVVWLAARSLRARFMGRFHVHAKEVSEPGVPESVLRFVQVLVEESERASSFLALLDAEPIRRREILKSCLCSLDSIPAATREEITSFLEDDQNFMTLVLILKRQMQSGGHRAVV